MLSSLYTSHLRYLMTFCEENLMALIKIMATKGLLTEKTLKFIS